MADHHPRLARQLADLGIDSAQPVTPADLQALLAKVSAYYVQAEHESDTLMTVLDTLSDTTCHVDQHGVLRGLNDRGLEFFRVEPTEMLNLPLLEVVHVEDGSGRRLTADDLHADRRIEQGLVVRRDGTRVAASISISRIAEGRRDEGAVVLFRDIEELLEREEDLQRARVEALVARKAERAKGLFLANMSHELRTPLNAIIGYSEILWEDAESNGRVEHMADLKRIRVAGRHLNHLIGGILDLAKIEAGRMELYFEPCDVVALARDSLDAVRQGAAAIELVLEVDEPPPPPIRADATRLRQCLYNLLSNAVKFTAEGRVAVRILWDDDAVRIEVVDTGIGIAPETIERLFSEFGQADAATTRRFGGTGLGLALSRRLCRLMGGDIEVESTLGAGSRFTIVLPVHAETRTTPAPAPTRGATVLVIDDDLAVRELLERTLSAAGYAVVCAPGGRIGLALAAELRPDAIVLDVLIPDLDGWSVLAALKSNEVLRRVPVILLTMVDDRRRGFALGAAEYLVKPVSREQLTEVLGRLAGPTGTALLVDDDPDVRALVSRQLASCGWNVREAEHGRAALERLAEQRPDVVLLDLMMPEMDGFELVGRLRADPALASLPVVVLTGMELDARERADLERSVQRILQKGSVGQQELLEELRCRITISD